MTSSGSTASPRLLTNLLTHEKEYAKTLEHALDAGGAAYTALLLYQPWLNNPPRPSSGEEAPGHSVIHALAHADAGLRVYAAAMDAYIEGLKELRDLEEGVRNLVRDREILVTRVLKTSNKSSNRDSIFSASSPSHSTVSLDSYSGKSYGPLGGKPSKLAHWQSELHGCENQLATAQRQLESKRVSAVQDGLRLRATAMVDCGTRWVEAGRAILQVEMDGHPLPEPGIKVDKPLPDDVSSLTPSQSASQTEPDVDLHIPPAHSIADLGLPTSIQHVLARRITEEDLNGASSSSDEEDVAVVENPRFGTGSKKLKDPPPVTKPRDESPSKSRFFGSIRGLFGSKKAASVSGGDAEEEVEKRAKPRKAKTWDTRTDKNLRHLDPVVTSAGSPSGSAFDVSTPRARRLRKDTPEKRQRRRSASLDGALPSESNSQVRDSSTPLPRKRSTKKKRAEGTTSTSTGVSRNSSITSAPATWSPRATSPPPPLPTEHRAPSQQRQSSLDLESPATTRTERRASSPVVPQGTSLMSIVEDVARANRQASMETLRARERTFSGGLVSVKAPQSFSKKEIDGLSLESFLPAARDTSTSKHKAGKVNSLFEVKAPASPTKERVEGLPDSSSMTSFTSSTHQPWPYSSQGPKSTSPSSVATSTKANGTASSSSGPSRPALSTSASRPPLRSALRNGGSRTPSPMSSTGRSPSPVKPMFVVQAPSPLHLDATPSVSQLTEEATKPRPSSPLKRSLTPSPPRDGDDDDGASISSYETTQEVFDDDTKPRSAPGSPAPPPPEKEDFIASSPPVTQNGFHNGTDVSVSSDSTVNNTGAPKRRKSVRVSLRPTFSPTPPAIEYEEWHPSENTVIDETAGESSQEKKHAWNSKSDEPADMWADSSDEDQEYSRARRLLSKVSRKEKKAHK